MIFTQFGNCNLPCSNVKYDLSHEAMNTIVELPNGGFFDSYHNAPAPKKPQKIGVKGVLVGCNHEEVMTAALKLEAMLGLRDKLKRTVLGQEQSCEARLLVFSMETLKSVKQRHLGVKCLFVRITEWR